MVVGEVRDGKKGGRGSSAKRDDVDAVWLMTARPGKSGGFQFGSDKSRMGWVPLRVDLVRASDDPLRHEVDSGKLSDKQMRLVTEMDALNLPNDVGRPKAKDALMAVGVRSSTEDLRHAVTFRKRRSGQVPGQDSWNTIGQGSGTGSDEDG